MKKIVLLISILLTLCACSSSHTTTVSDGDKVFYERPDKTTLTKQELYSYAKTLDVATSIKDNLVLKIAKLEGIDLDAFGKEAQEYVDEMVELGYEEFFVQYYGSTEAYIKDNISYSAATELKNRYIEANIDKYIKDYEPSKAAIIYFDNEESAKGTLETMKNENATFAYAATENGYSSEVVETVFTKSDTTLPSIVRDYVNRTNAPAVSDPIQVDQVTTDPDGNTTTNPRYYLVNLVSKDVNEFKDEFISTVSLELENETVIANLLKKYNFSVHDQDIYDLLSAIYGGGIK